jgi:hypothetical protein
MGRPEVSSPQPPPSRDGIEVGPRWQHVLAAVAVSLVFLLIGCVIVVAALLSVHP